MKKLVVLLVISSAFVMSGCNTMRGAGQDVQKVGEKVEDKARDVQSN